MAMMNSVLSTLQLLLARLVHGGEATVNTQDFSKALGLENDEMQDPNEFARLLFERMHESFVNNAGLANLLPSLFQGTMAYETTCRTCGNVSEREEGFMDLNLPIEKVSASATPTPKRTGQQTIKDMFGSKGSNADTDVQFCLNQYLRPEELTGDNQYFCERCQSKRDAERALTLHKLPPILNVQISRYVFDRAKFVKKKLSDKVLLPRVLFVPEKGGRSETKYLLCAVMKHQGTSAYQGHYVAEAMDWQSGTWFEFNDECVSVLENGPSCSYDPGLQEGAPAQKKPPAGSKDAYNMYYVKESYLGETTSRSVASNPTGTGPMEENERSIIGTVAKERQDRYRILNE
jgi:ubiquitin carboxyl-terminal hydrolase 48